MHAILSPGKQQNICKVGCGESDFTAVIAVEERDDNGLSLFFLEPVSR